MTNNLIELIDISIKDIDSCMRCHNLGNLQHNRKIFKMIYDLLDYVTFSYELGFINKLHYKHFSRLLVNRKNKLNLFYIVNGGSL